MGTIPVSRIVDVTISKTPQAPQRAGFGTLLFITQDTGVIDATEVREYANIDEVVIDWLATTETWKAANAYFSQKPSPNRFMVAFRDPVAEPVIADTLNRIVGIDNSWYAFAFSKETRSNDDVKGAAAWVESQIKEFFSTTNDADAKDSAEETNIAFFLNNLKYERTYLQYSSTVDEYPEVSAFGRMATVNFDAENSTSTLNLKKLPGITPENINSGQLTTLENRGTNVYTEVGGVNVNLGGYMVAGVGVWQDTIHGVDWLQNAIETNVFAYMVTIQNKIAYTDKGVQSIVAQVGNALDQAKRNGLVAEIGDTIDGTTLDNGYIITAGKVADQTISQKQSRIAPTIQFTAIGAGAIHGAIINGIFEV